MSHPTEVELLAFTHGDSPSDTAIVEAHLAACLLCRVQAGRLRIEEREAVSPSFLAALRDDAPRIDSSILETLQAAEVRVGEATIEVGQLWRARDRHSGRSGGTAVLVWIRKVFESTAAVLPVVLDIELADQETLLLHQDTTVLGCELAVLTNVDAEIDVSSLGTLIATLDIADDVNALRSASSSGANPPDHVRTGPAIVRTDDQRIEYRQIVGDLLNALFVDDVSDVDDGLEVHDLISELRELSFFHHGLRTETLPFDEVTYLDAHRTLHPVAAVHHLNACVVVALLTGTDAVAQLNGPRLPGFGALMQARFIESDTVAICAKEIGWPTVLLTPAQMSNAIEVPSGMVHDATAASGTLDLTTALLKYFEGATDTWDDATPVRFDDFERSLTDIKTLSTNVALAAVEDVLREGRRAVLEPKKAGYARLNPTTASEIGELISGVLAGADPDEALDALLEEPS
jgi:hypothetical protein